uniref:tRNA (guanine-N(7)-)-methyltransferase n=1 Tax=Chromera velia CCMP2878 TaxID=1169474 RepID=A0A0G4I5J8_9ALVE|eukprot:Cvel_11154.t1-p1 / transcript=Cvel_11154.t1 / gene=Cvel_11154 / organism=Chromera_velia_CCMP2878 / gene_product=tRNA (guanine-N(7)-)-methyltransferase, putative / transcript_product=tRNA (guanine-N(7)-)-methyltransferase, putative / location=Cvel_scaffold692:7894-13678(+) / protein_length=311 / sequence_SO=supercontig / SO=protein_coding / is_pseudo=false
MENQQKVKKPKKGEYRQRAHVNPFSDAVTIEYPPSPDWVDWSLHFPSFFGREEEKGGKLPLNTLENPVHYPHPVAPELNGSGGKSVEIVDVGCGFGGLTVALGSVFPSTLILGMEIRDKVTNYVGERIRSLRSGAGDVNSPEDEEGGGGGGEEGKEKGGEGGDGSSSGVSAGEVSGGGKAQTEEKPGVSSGSSSDYRYGNVSVMRQNVMKNCANYFRKGQVSCSTLLSVYAYSLRIGGLLYTVTDVEDLHKWMKKACSEHPLFEEVTEDQLKEDPCVRLMMTATEESKKVARGGLPMFPAVFKRVPPPPIS